MTFNKLVSISSGLVVISWMALAAAADFPKLALSPSPSEDATSESAKSPATSADTVTGAEKPLPLPEDVTVNIVSPQDREEVSSPLTLAFAVSNLETAPAESGGVLDAAPAADDTGAMDKAPAADDTGAMDKAPAADDTSAMDKAPAADDTSAMDKAPAAGDSSAMGSAETDTEGKAPTKQDVYSYLIVDGDDEPPATDKPLSDEIERFDASQSTTEVELDSGEHTLQLVLGDENRLPYEPAVTSEKITVTVK